MAKKSIEVTEVRVNKVTGSKSKLKGFASITLNSGFVVTGVRIVSGKDGLFVAMPSTKGADGEYYDTCFPLSAELREEISKRVLDEFED